MTPKRPIELVNASAACGEAWLKRDAMIEAGDTVGIQVMNSACGILDARYNSLYQQWQILGGTSDIDSLAFPPEFVDAWSDPRTPEQKAADEFAQEVEYTRLKDWDVTPTPKMPIIDFGNIDEIPF